MKAISAAFVMAPGAARQVSAERQKQQEAVSKTFMQITRGLGTSRGISRTFFVANKINKLLGAGVGVSYFW